MPLSINVGLSRKASRDFQSAGTSINVTAELDQALLARPDELQHEIAGLYAQAEQALDSQSTRARGHPGGDAQDCPGNQPPPGRYPGADVRPATDKNQGRDYGHGNGTGRGGGPATASQRRAVHAIAAGLGVDPHLEARDIVGVDFADLTIRQASDLIDHLKSMGPAAGGGNGRAGNYRR
jgi:hypothetical protein